MSRGLSINSRDSSDKRILPDQRSAVPFFEQLVEGNPTSLMPVNKSDLSVILLTGGSSRRMGSDKASLDFGNDTLLKFQLDQIPHGFLVIVVGESIEAGPELMFTREDPPGSGPVAAIAAGMALVNSPVVLLLAVDAPFALPQLLDLDLAPHANALIPRDQGGKVQYLAGIYRTDPLRCALERLGSPEGKSMRELISNLPNVELLALTVENAKYFIDVDTPADLATAREFMSKHPKVDP